MKRKLATIIAMSTALALVACSGSGTEPDPSATPEVDDELAELIAAAQEEGEVVYYSSEADVINNAVAEAFEATYGIKVRQLQIASSLMATRIAEERGAGIVAYDVARTSDGEIFLTEEWWEVLTPELVPVLAEYPEDAFGPAGTDVSSQWSYYNAMYNTDMVSEEEAPKTWPDLLDPKWDGDVQFVNLARGARSWWGWADAMVQAHGFEYLEQLSEMDLEIIDSAGGDTVSAGSHSLTFPQFYGHAQERIEAGAPIASVTLTDPMPLKADHIGIATDAPHPNAARLFANFRLSAEFLKVTCELSDLAVPIEGIEGCRERQADDIIVRDVWTVEEFQPYLDALGMG